MEKKEVKQEVKEEIKLEIKQEIQKEQIAPGLTINNDTEVDTNTSVDGPDFNEETIEKTQKEKEKKSTFKVKRQQTAVQTAQN